MPAPTTVTLFTEQVDPSRRPATLAVSALIHAGVIALVSFGILYAPKVVIHANQGLTVRHIDLRRPEDAMRRALKGVQYPGPQRHAQKLPAGKAGSHAASLAETARARLGPQTLVQPDVKPVEVTEKIPLPQVLIWTPPNRLVKNIVAPLPEPATAAQARPSLNTPNQEINVSDVDIASSVLASQKLQILPSTTSPVVVPGDLALQLPPSTVSQVSAQPTPAAVMSLSDLRMQGAATLPPVNETASADTPGVLAASPAKSGSAQGNGSGSGDSAGNGDGAGQDSKAGSGADSASNAARPAGREGQPGGATGGPTQGSNSGGNQDGTNSTTDITLPKAGVFGAVVVGDSLQDEYPELSGVWNGRLAYTVYLHVGLSRSWILQYSLPPDATINLSGREERLEAPWPYNIVRPNLTSGVIGADALMVHGFVNTTGHFEDLSIVFPAAFPQAQFVLESLARWQFRPATENGQFARVEVLLIIPEELD